MSGGYGQFCAMARALEVIGERWTLLVVRELLCGSTGFNQIRRGIPAIPRDTLAKRLRQLCAAGVVERHGSGTSAGYSLTPAGHALTPVMLELAAWTKVWDMNGLQSEHLDPDVLFWDLQRRVDHDQVPAGRTVVRFELDDGGSARYLWLMVDADGAEVCATNGGHEPQLFIESSTLALSQWWLGDLDWSTAIRSGRIRLHGHAGHAATFPTWFLGYALNPTDPSSG